MEAIQLAFTIDKSYVQHLGVLLCSLFEHNPENTFIIYLVLDFQDNDELQKLKEFVAAHRHEVVIVHVEADAFSAFKLSDHASSAVYYRLLLPRLLDDSLEKILYLDADIIIKKDLLPLWNTDLQRYPLAAVAEPLFSRHEMLGLSAGTPYFNSGVMLINLSVWRQQNIGERAMHFIRENPERIIFWDQDGLNAILEGEWLPLSLSWNMQSQFYDDRIKTNALSQEVVRATNDPAIIHFSSKFKPWHYWCDHPLKSEYFDYLKKTPWKDYKIDELSKWQLLKQKIKREMARLFN